MNICIITMRYPYKDNMEFVFVKKLVDEWAKMGHRCVVITPFPQVTYWRKRIKYKPKYYRDEIAPGIYVDVYNPRIFNTQLTVKGVEQSNRAASRAVERQIHRTRIQFDVIYCHFFRSALYGFHYAQKNNIPFFVATGESGIDHLLKPYPKFTWADFRTSTTGVIAVSSKNKKEAAQMGYIDEAKCKVFPNGTDTKLFTPLDKASCREKLGLSHDAFLVSCVGFICERKGQNRLLEAVQKLNDKNIKLLFIGAAAPIETFPLEGEEILFKGTVKNTELPSYLCASDVFCLPTRAEGCCNAIIEALACGLPIVSSNLPFNWDVLDDRNSIMVNPNDVNEIANAIQCLKDNEGRRITLSDGALKKAQSLDIHQRAENILAFFSNRMR